MNGYVSSLEYKSRRHRKRGDKAWTAVVHVFTPAGELVADVVADNRKQLRQSMEIMGCDWIVA